MTRCAELCLVLVLLATTLMLGEAADADAKCVAAKGRCQQVTAFCCGVYKKGLCGGTNLCCIACWLEGAVSTICTGSRPSASLFDR
ncbi:hypothetical protein NP493_701g01052 [Ridgeia piscesae]|uniref:Uncharacterized protein n=1 Tax=Ridgeia piscesae TaxID=27915 RepID=A0AAD9KRB0_RIDPI|nr:hypothetical protein NP493_701g01052 [Ridgeia piscesae]